MTVHIKDPSDVLSICTDNFSEDKVRKALENLKHNKPAGVDGISAEIMKSRGVTIVQWICSLHSQVGCLLLFQMTGKWHHYLHPQERQPN